MADNFLIAPDFSPEHFAGWHLLNTLLQKRADINLHLVTPAGHAEQESLINEGNVSIIYANPFDAAKMIREQGYKAIAKPTGKTDEMVIASSANGEIQTLDDLKKGATITTTNNRDVKLIGMRLLEAVDLGEDDVKFDIVENYQAAARALIQGKADAAFFIADVYNNLTNLTKSQLTVLIESNISTISHIVLVKENFDKADTIKDILLSLTGSDDGKAVLKELDIADGFSPMSEEEAEFMIDLMETLLD